MLLEVLAKLRTLRKSPRVQFRQHIAEKSGKSILIYIAWGGGSFLLSKVGLEFVMEETFQAYLRYWQRNCTQDIFILSAFRIIITVIINIQT